MAVSRRKLIGSAVAAAIALLDGDKSEGRNKKALAPIVAPDKFQPNWDSLAAYQAPDWFRNAKFGIWAAWGPQCVPGQGDWYARGMYQEGSKQYNYHCATYGHPSKFGFKDITNIWHAESWDPEHLIGLYKAAGARYFMCMANHHDDFDNYDSTYQSWNSVAIGPKRDVVGEWEKAVRNAGLKFGVSVHAAHAWLFYEEAQGADTKGPLAGVPYDGKVTSADGAGQWWDGLDPQELYAQNHARSSNHNIDAIWGWPADGTCSLPTDEYCEKFYNRVTELIDKYHPDQLYFDDTVLPFYPINDIGVRIASYFYNANIKQNGGSLEAVINGKILSDQQKKCLISDLERGISNEIEPYPYQTDTCIGNWHYDINLFEHHKYKTADQVSHMLVDIVSKNGNLMLNIPLPGNGAPDADELKFLADFTAWMRVNSEGIYDTRPWQICGEGPGLSGPAVRAQGFNEGHRQYTAQDFRFTQKGPTIYAYAMAWPEDGQLLIQSLPITSGNVKNVTLLGSWENLTWKQTAAGLSVSLPAEKPCNYVYGLKISGEALTPAPAPTA